jgi:uncharacterized membrane protein (UPF0127 family)
VIQRVVVLVVVLAACGGGTTATTPVSTSAPVTIQPPTTTAPVGLPGFDTATIGLGGADWSVALADTPDLRRRGLMGVTDLGGLDGMLFVFEGDTAGDFWMKDTLIPLDIAFFDAAGAPVGEVITMTPCGDADPCPTYGPDAPYRYALETTVGGFEGIEEMVLHPSP